MGTVVVKRSYQSKQGNRVRCAKNDGARRGGSRTAPAANRPYNVRHDTVRLVRRLA